MAIGEVGEINVRITADTASLERGVKRADSSLGRLRGRLADAEKQALKFGAALASAATVAGSIKLVQVARQADILRASLRTATGSTEAAANAFKALEQFAARTPFALEQSVEAFIKLKNLGLDPSERALESYGNTASAMGKSMNQMIEAVADASTMEFERLKEFGIKARQEGDNVQFTFRGVTTSVKKNAKDIQGFLLSIGETEFAGAMAERAKTLDGAISNLEDSFNGLFRAIGDRGATDSIADAFRSASEALDDFTNQIQSGEIEERLAALGGLFDGWASDIEKAFGGTASVVSEEVGEALDFLADAFSDLPENARAMVQLFGVELAVIGDRGEAVAEAVVKVFTVKLAGLVDKAKAIGKAIGSALNPFSDGGPDLEEEFAKIDEITADLSDSYFAAAEARIEASRQARIASIEDILAERDAAQEAYTARVEAAEEMTERLKELNKEALTVDGKTPEEQESEDRERRMAHFEQLLGLSSQGFDALNRVAKEGLNREQQLMVGAFSSMAGSLSKHNREMFELNKAAGIANALVATYQGAAEALKLGWPLGPIAAAAIAANGFAQVQAIRSQSFAGSGGGGGSSPAVGAGGVSAAPPVAEGAATGQSDVTRRVLVEGIDPNALISGRQLIEILNEAQQDGPALITVSR